MANQVLDIIKQRHHTGSKPGQRDDPYKIALNVEGGGLRGVVSMGALASIEALNLQDCFDVSYGSSSGAYNLCYFLSGRSLDGAKIYLDYVNDRHFINYFRIIKEGKFFDLDYLEHHIIHSSPLKWQKVLSASVPLHVIATDADQARKKIFKAYKDREELFRSLYASAYIPKLVHMSPYSWRRRHYLDAGFLDPFGIHSALEEKNTHILILFSKPWRHRKSMGLLDRDLMAPQLRKINRRLGEAYLHHGEYAANGLSHVWNHYDGTHVLAIAPKSDRGLPSQLTIDRKKLAFGFMTGAMSVLKAFDVNDDSQRYILENFKRELRIG